MRDLHISPELAARIGASANQALDHSFSKFVDRGHDRVRRAAAQNEVAQALLRGAVDEGRLPKSLFPESPAPQQVLAALRGSGRLRRPTRHSPAARAMAFRPFAGVESGGVRVAEDSQIQVLAPPYAGQWTSKNGNGNYTATASADAASGAFGFLDGSGGGASAACGAGVWMQFIPDNPLPRSVQVRPYVPYNYQWHDSSQAGYTAHNDGGFGVYVLSWNMQGADQTLEQDYRYSIWSDGTGWWDDHHNPSWGDPDYGYAYTYNEAPYFTAQPGRIYQACVWCFGSCDAAGGFFGNAFSDADINADAGFVVIGEQ